MTTSKSSDKVGLNLELMDHEVKFLEEDTTDKKGNLMMTKEQDEDFQDTSWMGTHS